MKVSEPPTSVRLPAPLSVPEKVVLLPRLPTVSATGTPGVGELFVVVSGMVPLPSRAPKLAVVVKDPISPTALTVALGKALALRR